jgi:hypothetical protein
MLKKIFINLIILSLILLPVLVLAQDTSPLVPECGTLSKEGKLDKCTFLDFFNFIGKIIEFLIFYLSIPIAVLLFLYSGALYLFSPIAENKGKAIKIFWSVVWGFVIMIGAWLFIEFLKGAFLKPEFLQDVNLAP